MALAAIGPTGQAMLDGRATADVLGFELEVQLRALDAEGNPGVQAVERVGIIDTGASHIHIDRRAVKQLGLRARDRRTAEIASGEKLVATVYNGVIVVPALQVSLITEFYSFEEQQSQEKVVTPPSRILIGRSFLRNFLVTFDGSSGIVTFGKPSGHYSLPVDDE